MLISEILVHLFYDYEFQVVCIVLHLFFQGAVVHYLTIRQHIDLSIKLRENSSRNKDMCKKIRPNYKMDNNLVNLPGLMDILPNITYHLDCDRLGFSMSLTPGNLIIKGYCHQNRQKIGISNCLLACSLLSNTLFMRKQNDLKVQFFCGIGQFDKFFCIFGGK